MLWRNREGIVLRYAQVRNMDISNGDGIGISLFVQGCHFHCDNCFNSEAWDFNGGSDWTAETQLDFVNSINRTQIKRVSILGGEPLADENLEGVLGLVKDIRALTQNKKIWIYSGYTWKQIMHPAVTDDLNPVKYELLFNRNRKKIVSMCDILVDGKYIDSQRNTTLKWRGSKNQRVIDVQKSLEKGEVALFCN